jgi:hypothetical protein
LKTTREEYTKLKLEVIKFKKDKIGTGTDDTLDISKPLTPLEMHRLPFTQFKGKNRKREMATLSRLEEFKQRLRSQDLKSDEEHWMNNKLKFHIDSERAYGLQKVYDIAASQTQLAKQQDHHKPHADRPPAPEESSAPSAINVDIDEVVQHITKQ